MEIHEGEKNQRNSSDKEEETEEDEEEEEEESEEFDLNTNLVHLGVWGCSTFPLGIYSIALFLVFMCPAQYMTAHTASFEPKHHCKLLPDESANDSIPSLVDARGHWQLDKCRRFNYSSNNNNDNDNNRENQTTIPCDRGWEYIDAIDGESIVTEWDLVCSSAWVTEFSTSMINVGQAVGGLLVQPLADRFGRRKMIVICLLGTVVCGLILGTLVNGVLTYILFRCLTGIFFAAYLLIDFVIIIELFSAKHRMLGDMIAEVVWGFGAAALALALYWFPQWRHFTLFISVPLCVGFLFIVVFPPDSLPWLMTNGRQEEVKIFLSKQLEKKGKKLVYLTPAESEKRKKEAAAVKMDKAGEMMKNFTIIAQLAICAFIQLVNSLLFYALSLMATDLGDRHWTLFLAGIVEVPGYIIAGVSLHFLGRRGPMVMFHALVGVLLASVSAIDVFGPENRPTELDILAKILYFGAKFGISASYAIVFLFTPEIFPTNIRNTTVGIVDSVARIGGVLAPFSSVLDSLYPSLPVFLFAVLSLLAAFSSLFLPECHNQKLPDNLAELRRLYKGTIFWSFNGKRKKMVMAATEEEQEQEEEEEVEEEKSGPDNRETFL